VTDPPVVLVVGSINVDEVFAVRTLPRPGETVLSTSRSTGLGGKGSNQAVALARMGVGVRMVAAVARDANGEFASRALRAEGVDLDLQLTPDDRTGEAIVLVASDGENSIVVSGGANLRLEAAHAARVVTEHPTAAAVLVQGEIPSDAVMAALSGPQGLRVLNPAPTGHIRSEHLAAATVIVPNRTELSQLTGRPVSNLVEIEAAVQQLDHDNVVVTLGAEGAYVAIREAPPTLVPAPKVTPVDTTGAGDTFCGALVGALVLGRPLLDAARFAVQVAAASTRFVGAQTGMPTIDVARAWLPVDASAAD
jgi:ribokinase